MRYRRLGRTGLEVSEIGLGALEIGRDWGIRIEGDYGRPAEREAIALIHAALDLGINFIDTAPAYQLSEERIGKALRGHRDDAYVATKVGEHYDDARGFWYDYSPPAVQSSIEQSLRRLQTDYIDVIQIHSASQEIVERGEVLEVMQRFRQAGHVRFLGLSCGEDAARAAIDSGQYDTIQVDYNILDQTMAGSVFPQASERDVGVVIMAPLAHGALTAKQDFLEPDNPLRRKLQELRFLIRPDQTLAQAALRFVLACDAVSTLIAGTRKRENLRGNVEAADEPLSAEDRERIEDLYQRDFGLLETG